MQALYVEVQQLAGMAQLVVPHRPSRFEGRDAHAKLADVGDGGLEEGGDTGAGLVGRDLGEADAGVLVDADPHVVPASPGRALAAVPGDAVAGLRKAREFLDVQVKQLTGTFPLVTPDRRSRFEGVEPVEPCPAQDSADGGRRDPHGPCNLDPRLALETQRRVAGDDANLVAPGCRCGRELRSARPSRPSA